MKHDSQTHRPAPIRPFRACSLMLLAALSAGLTGCGAPPSGVHVDEALFELDGANFERAHYEVQRALELDPDSPQLQKLAKNTRILWLLDEARELVFEDKEELALAVLAQVRVLDPENASAARWIAKARGQLGAKKVFEGQEALSGGKLDEALARFREALELVPGNEAAIRGYRDVGRVFSERRESAEERYRWALRAQLDGDWRRVLHHAAIAMAQDPTREDARELVDTGERQRADAARLGALGFEEEQDFGAAARRYEQALEMGRRLEMVWVDQVEKRLERMRREFRAEQLLDRFEVELAADRFSVATETLAEAEKLTVLQTSRVNESRLELLAGQRLERMDEARLLEVDHRYENALTIYEKLASERSDSRVEARVERIQNLIETCAELVAEASKQIDAGEKERAIGTLKQALALHCRYEPAKRMLAELELSSD